MIANERASKHFEFTINRPLSRSPRMKQLLLIEGLPKDKLFSAIKAVVRQVLLCELETVTSLEVMESDRANQFAVRPNRLCGGWDFYSLCGLFKSELSARKDVVIKAWFQLPSDETMSVLPKGKYFLSMCGSGATFFSPIACKCPRDSVSLQNRFPPRFSCNVLIVWWQCCFVGRRRADRVGWQPKNRRRTDEEQTKNSPT